MSLLSTIKTSLDKFFLLRSSKQPSAVVSGEGDGDNSGSSTETARTRENDGSSFTETARTLEDDSGSSTETTRAREDDDEPELPVSYMPYYVCEGIKVFQGMDELRDYQSAVAVSGRAFKESADATDPNSLKKDVHGTFHKFMEHRHPRMEKDAPSACRVIEVHDGANGRTLQGD